MPTADFPQRQAIIDEDTKHRMLSAYYERMVTPKRFAYESKEQWQAYCRRIRGRVWECLGLSPRPEITPPDMRCTGELEREGYTIQRLYWQSFPEIYASGYLYRPTNIPGQVPAVLCPHGHWALGARDPVVQARCIALALKGYVALAVDSVHVGDYPVGISPLTAMMWNNIRAVDLLCSMPEVDSSRIGCTGESGGGQQTMYLQIMDDRIAAAAPVVLVCWFRKIMFYEGAHCWCNHVPGLMKYLDQPQMCAAFAPKPCLFECVTEDWTADFPTDGFPEIQAVYRSMGAEENVAVLRFEGPHDFNRPMREAVYAWFNKHLKGIEDPAEAVEPPLQTESPDVLSALSRPVPGDQGMEAVGEYLRSRHAVRRTPTRTLEEARERALLWRNDLPGLLGEDRPEAIRSVPLNIVRRSSITGDGFLALPLHIDTEEGITSPGVLFMSGHDHSPAPVVIAVHPEGRVALMGPSGPAAWIRTLLQQGISVLTPDLRLRGELAHDWWANGLLWGRPQAGMAAHDLLKWIECLRTLTELQAGPIGLVGIGESGAECAFAAALEENIRALAIDVAGFEKIPNLERRAGIADSLGALAPLPLYLRTGQDTPDLTNTRAAYALYDHGSPLHIVRDTSEEAMAAWMAETLR